MMVGKVGTDQVISIAPAAGLSPMQMYFPNPPQGSDKDPCTEVTRAAFPPVALGGPLLSPDDGWDDDSLDGMELQSLLSLLAGRPLLTLAESTNELAAMYDRRCPPPLPMAPLAPSGERVEMRLVELSGDLPSEVLPSLVEAWVPSESKSKRRLRVYRDPTARLGWRISL